jgi:predicted O-methyltransferase YrrM
MKALARQVLPSFVWERLKRAKADVLSPANLQSFLDRYGYVVARKSDYYSPLTSVSELKSTFNRWHRPSALNGIEYDLDQMKAALSDLLSRYLPEFMDIPPYEQLDQAGWGHGYTAVDALTLYMMIRHLKPKRYVEVGSGLSTYYCSLAAARNASEGHPLVITCIEPYPFKKLFTIPGIEIIVKLVQDVEVSLFERLDSDDVLFIDSSHVLRIDGDVPFLYLEVLPTLAAGVFIHIHDVPFPYNVPYPPQLWVFGQEWPMLWNEAMMVQAFLSMNREFKIKMSTPLLRHFAEDFLKRSIPIYQSIDQNPNTFSSLWLQRVS